MSLTLNLPLDLENELSEEAAGLGLPLSDYAVHVLVMRRNLPAPLKNGAELIAYWQEEGVVGMRTDIIDSRKHARKIRTQAERRTHK